MEEFHIDFITHVVTGNKDHDLVVFGPPLSLPGGQKFSLEAWIPKDKGARKGFQVIGNPDINVSEDQEFKKTYTDSRGEEVALKTWKLRVVIGGNFGFKPSKSLSLAEFLKNKA